MENLKVETELPDQMAGLDIMEIDNHVAEAVLNEPPSDVSVRVLRKRKTLVPNDLVKPTNRRVRMKPLKRIVSENANSTQIEALYLNKKVNSTSQTLETIYEETKDPTSDTKTVIGGRKVKRLLTFQLGSHYTKEKIKKRRAKIKKFLGNKAFLNRKKIPMHEFLKTMDCLDFEEPVKTDIKSTINT